MNSKSLREDTSPLVPGKGILAFAIIVFLLVLAASAWAQSTPQAPATPVAPSAHYDVALSQQDAGNLQQICTFATEARMPDATGKLEVLNLATKTQIGQVCLDLLGRFAQAEKDAKAKEAAAKPAAASAAKSEPSK